MEYVPTEKQNRNMKAKVLKYKFDGNTIVAPYMERKHSVNPVKFQP